MDQFRCFVCLSCTNTKYKKLYRCCTCRMAHEQCFVNYIYSKPSSNNNDVWKCNACREQYETHLSGTSFFSSLCSRNIDGPRKLRAIISLFLFEFLQNFLLQLLLCAYEAKIFLWIFTHSSVFVVTEYLSFTLTPNWSDLLLGAITFLILVFPSVLVMYCITRLQARYCPPKRYRLENSRYAGDEMAELQGDS